MSRLERLVNLTAALIDAARPLTREELRERVGGYSDDPVAFRRNFERDKDLLRQMGMPVATEVIDPEHPETSVGYRIHRGDYELPDPGLDESELAALRLATSAVQVDGSDEATATALRKLAGIPARRPSLDPGDPGPAAGGIGEAAGSAPTETTALPGGPETATVFGALAARRRIEFTYRGQRRVVDPWKLSYRNGQWYLSGHDHRRSDARLFRLDRVEGAVVAVGEAGAYERPAAGVIGPARPWQIGEDEEVMVDLHVDGRQAAWARTALGEGSVVSTSDDGSVRFGVAVTNRAAFRSFVLGMLEHAEIVGPAGVRADMVAWLDAQVAH